MKAHNNHGDLKHLLVLKDRPPIHNSKRSIRALLETPTFCFQTNGYCFLFHGSYFQDTQKTGFLLPMFWLFVRKIWFHFIVTALKMQSKIGVFPYAKTFDLKKSFNPKWSKWRTGLKLNRMFELMLSEKLNRHKKYGRQQPFQLQSIVRCFTSFSSISLQIVDALAHSMLWIHIFIYDHTQYSRLHFVSFVAFDF